MLVRLVVNLDQAVRAADFFRSGWALVQLQEALLLVH